MITSWLLRRAAVVLGSAAAVAVSGVPAHAAAAPAKTTLTITSITRSGSLLKVSGAEVFGQDASVPLQVAAGSGTCTGCQVPAGQALGKAFIAFSPAAGTVTFTVDVTNQPAPPAPALAPGYVIDWQLAVDGKDNGFFLQTAAAGSASFPTPTAAPYWTLCQNTSAGFTCGLATFTGQLGGGLASWTVPLTAVTKTLALHPGATISSGHSLGTAPTIASTLDAAGAALFFDTGGDAEAASPAVLPGAVRLGVAVAGTPVSKVKLGPPVFVSGTGGFTGTVKAPAGTGTFEAVAVSCWGAAGGPQTCVTATRTFTQ